MSISHTMSVSYQGAGQTLSVAKTTTDETDQNGDWTIPAPSTDLKIAFSLDVSELKQCVLYSNVDLTIETNSGSTPAQVITLEGGAPLDWIAGNASKAGGAPAGTELNPFGTTNVTDLFVTLGGTTDALLQIRTISTSA